MESQVEKHEFYENARKRVREKRNVYYHFVLFLIGSVILIIVNKVLGIGENGNILGFSLKNWFIPVVLIWFFFLLTHTVRVFIFHTFMGKDWERRQTDKLVAKQEKRVAKLEQKIAKEYQKEAKQLIEEVQKEEEVKQELKEETDTKKEPL